MTCGTKVIINNSRKKQQYNKEYSNNEKIAES
jgi:hypothetical protein